MEISKSMPNGNLVLDEKVLKDIAVIAAGNVAGIYPTKKDGFVSCKVDKLGNIDITVSIRLKQGINLVKTCTRLQNEISDSVSGMTGLSCNNINIDIQGFVDE